MSKGKWFSIGAVCILAAGIALRAYMNQIPGIGSIPTVSLPSPNAFDTYRKALPLLRDKGELFYAITPANKPPAPAWVKPGDLSSGWHLFSLKEKMKILNDNEDGLNVIHRGLHQEFMYPRIESFTEHATRLGGLGMLVCLESQVRARQGDWSGSMNSGIDAIEFGTQIEHGGAMFDISDVSRHELRAYETINAANLVDKLSSGEAKKNALRLIQIDARSVSPADAMQQEEWNTQASLLHFFKQPDWWQSQSTGGWESPYNWAYDATMLLKSPRSIYGDYTRYMNSEVALMRLTWPNQCDKDPPMPKDRFSDAMVRLSDIDPFSLYTDRTLNKLLEVQLALRAYQLDNHKYPRSLNELVPKYLPSVPIDPFSDNQPLKYRMKGSGYVLYSVGPDSIDGGGVPINNAKSDSELSTEQGYDVDIDPNAAGDIVAGVNY